MNLVRAREDPPAEPIKSEHIKMSDSDDKQDHERVDFVRARMESAAKLMKTSPI